MAREKINVAGAATLGIAAWPLVLELMFKLRERGTLSEEDGNDVIDRALSLAEQVGGNSPATLRLETLHEAQCAQIMHIGPTKTRDPQLPRSTTSSFQIMG